MSPDKRYQAHYDSEYLEEELTNAPRTAVSPGKRSLSAGLSTKGSSTRTPALILPAGLTRSQTRSQPLAAMADPFAGLLDSPPSCAPVQFLGGATAVADPTLVASQGIAGLANVLPHRDTIQEAFGRHDVGSIRAHTGTEEAAAATERLGARAYATGNDVVFDSAPDVFTAAHEATHVLQQQAGMVGDRTMGQDGDVFEKWADRVAQAVVDGSSAEPLLDRMLDGAATQTTPTRAVQLKRRGGSAGGELYQDRYKATWETPGIEVSSKQAVADTKTEVSVVAEGELIWSKNSAGRAGVKLKSQESGHETGVAARTSLYKKRVSQKMTAKAKKTLKDEFEIVSIDIETEAKTAENKAGPDKLTGGVKLIVTTNGGHEFRPEVQLYSDKVVKGKRVLSGPALKLEVRAQLLKGTYEDALIKFIGKSYFKGTITVTPNYLAIAARLNASRAGALVARHGAVALAGGAQALAAMAVAAAPGIAAVISTESMIGETRMNMKLWRKAKDAYAAANVYADILAGGRGGPAKGPASRVATKKALAIRARIMKSEEIDLVTYRTRYNDQRQRVFAQAKSPLEAKMRQVAANAVLTLRSQDSFLALIQGEKYAIERAQRIVTAAFKGGAYPLSN